MTPRRESADLRKIRVGGIWTESVSWMLGQTLLAQCPALRLSYRPILTFSVAAIVISFLTTIRSIVKKLMELTSFRFAN